jgi:hypothetical protein
VPSHLDTWKVLETLRVGGEDRAAGSQCGRGDDEVVGAAGPARLADGRQQLGVSVGDPDVIRQGRDHFQNSVDEGLTRGAAPSLSQVHSDQELSHRHRRDGDVVVVGDDLVEVPTLSLGADQEGRIEQQQVQGRSSSESDPRTSSTSRAH